MMASTLDIRKVMLSILKSMYQDSRERRSTSAQIYRRAYRALQACPLPLQHPAETVQLDGFGETLATELEKRLLTYCREHGKTMPKRPEIASSSRDGVASTASSSSSTSEEDDFRPKKKAAKAIKGPVAVPAAKSKAKQFVPQHRSGSHGILVSLYSLTECAPDSDPDGDAVSHSKATIIEHAQPYSDAKYVPKPMPLGMNRGPSFAFSSAWSSMKTLVNRGYVYRRGNPAKFSLSREGWEVASTCAAKDGVLAGSKIGQGAASQVTSDQDCDSASEEKERGPVPRREEVGRRSKARASSSEAQTLPKKRGHREERDASASSRGQGRSTDTGPFLYMYLRDGQAPSQTMERSKAGVRLSDDDYTMTYRITFEESLSNHPFVKACVNDVVALGSVGQRNLLAGYVRASSSNERAPGFGQLIPAPRRATAAASRSRSPSPLLRPRPTATVAHGAHTLSQSPPRSTASIASSLRDPSKKAFEKRRRNEGLLSEKSNLESTEATCRPDRSQKGISKAVVSGVADGDIIEIVTSSDVENNLSQPAEIVGRVKGTIVDIDSSDDSSDSSLGDIYEYLSSSQQQNAAKRSKT